MSPLLSDQSDDLVVELDGPRTREELDAPLTGEEREPMPSWALPTRHRGSGWVRYPRDGDLRPEALARAFPFAWPELQSWMPIVGPDDVFDDVRGHAGPAKWRRFVADLEKRESELAQVGARTRRLICKGCGVEGVLDDFERCFGGCDA